MEVELFRCEMKTVAVGSVQSRLIGAMSPVGRSFVLMMVVAGGMKVSTTDEPFHIGMMVGPV